MTNPPSPLAYSPGSTRLAAGYELLYRLGKDYEKPEFELHQIEKNGHAIPIVEQIVTEKPCCRLIRFKRFPDDSATVTELKTEPIVLVCAPASGHHSTVLRDTVKTLLQDHKVYLTDCPDPRFRSGLLGDFELDRALRFLLHHCCP